MVTGRFESISLKNLNFQKDGGHLMKAIKTPYYLHYRLTN